MFNTLIEWMEKLMTPETQPSEWRTRAKAAEALARDFETQNARLRVIIRKIQDDMKAINDMPIGLQVGDGLDSAGRPQWENLANGDGPVLGREFEIANILSYIKRNRIANVLWITADVHYCAAHYYSPEKAQFKDFNPFWEFVAGPLNAGSFGPNALDNTFGPEVIFQSFPPAANFSPFAGLQFFGQVDIGGPQAELVMSLKDINRTSVFTQKLQPTGR